jgi:hypothetical protein
MAFIMRSPTLWNPPLPKSEFAATILYLPLLVLHISLKSSYCAGWVTFVLIFVINNEERDE